MCGRSRCAAAPRAVAGALGVPAEKWKDAEKYKPCHNVSPGHYTPVLYKSKEGERKVRLMRWGLVPSFTKKGEKPDFWRMFNARSESIAVSPAFRRLINRKRCVVFVDGFYEWKERQVKTLDGKKAAVKQPYFIHFEGRPHMLMAGLYDVWVNEADEILFTYTILTTRVAEGLKWLHHRMPVILTEEQMEDWISDKPLEDVLRTNTTLLQPYQREAEIKWHPVARNVNKLSYNEEDAAVPFDIEAEEKAVEEAFKARSITRFFGGGSSTKKKETTPKKRKERGEDTAAVEAGTSSGGAGAGAGAGAGSEPTRAPPSTLQPSSPKKRRLGVQPPKARTSPAKARRPQKAPKKGSITSFFSRSPAKK